MNNNLSSDDVAQPATALVAPRPRTVRRDNFSAKRRNLKHTYSWPRVMCLSGVDYFSTLGYQPGIAVVAAGALAPIATLVLVAVTLLGVVPVYRHVAERSPNGLGSISLLEGLLSGWKGKFAVLVLLGFAMTDFIITMTLSSADAAAHLLGTASSPWQLEVTLALIAALAVVFFRGFREAVSVASFLVVAYLFLTGVVMIAAGIDVAHHPEVFSQWGNAMHERSTNPAMLALLAVVVFPKLALGLSGFEAGVSVMPLIKASDVPQRIERTKKLLLTSAAMMSTMLVISSWLVSLLIPAEEFADGGSANGRALAWLAHHELGAGFGHVYDIATVAILWFAGASAMSGLLALIPNYLPRYGMAPEWARRSRPMVGVLAIVAVLVTFVFHADVERQAGAYATGVLVVLSAGGVAVAILLKGWRRKIALITSVVLVLTLIANIIERPDGIHVAAFFIVGIVAISLGSRVWRAYELRGAEVTMDAAAREILKHNSAEGELVIVPTAGICPRKIKDNRIRRHNHLDNERLVFLQIQLHDPSQFSEKLEITGRREAGVDVLRARSSSIPNAVAATALEVERLTGVVPDVYFEWSPGNPWKEMARFIFLGDGQNATVTHEILRRAVPDELRRPRIHLC